MKRKISLVLIVALFISLVACAKPTQNVTAVETTTVVETTTAVETTSSNDIVLSDVGVKQDKQFGALNLDIKKEDFLKKGFEYGDSIDVSFNNDEKTTFTNIPFYSGMYANPGDVMLMNHHAVPNTILMIQDGAPIFEKYNISDDAKVTVKLNQRGKYKEIQETFDLHYSDNREDYASDEIFANFRCVKGGNLKDNLIYRGTSPVDNSHNRATYAAKFVEENGIDYIIDISDNQDKFNNFLEKGAVTDYEKKIYDAGHVDLLGLGVNFKSEKTKKRIAESLKKMAESSCKKIYNHCTEGKDRTGFMTLLMLSLADASYDEIADDFMISYKNYYNITKEGDPTRYNNVINYVFNRYISAMCNDDGKSDYKNVNLKENAEKYLLSGGLTESDVKNIESFLTK